MLTHALGSIEHSWVKMNFDSWRKMAAFWAKHSYLNYSKLQSTLDCLPYSTRTLARIWSPCVFHWLCSSPPYWWVTWDGHRAPVSSTCYLSGSEGSIYHWLMHRYSSSPARNCASKALPDQHCQAELQGSLKYLFWLLEWSLKRSQSVSPHRLHPTHYCSTWHRTL